jgi:hypothetical protein
MLSFLKIAMLVLSMDSADVAELHCSDDGFWDAAVLNVLDSDTSTAAHGVVFIANTSDTPINDVLVNYLDCGFMDETARAFSVE